MKWTTEENRWFHVTHSRISHCTKRKDVPRFFEKEAQSISVWIVIMELIAAYFSGILITTTGRVFLSVGTSTGISAAYFSGVRVEGEISRRIWNQSWKLIHRFSIAIECNQFYFVLYCYQLTCLVYCRGLLRRKSNDLFHGKTAIYVAINWKAFS